jgi:prepilin-type processing-associated H-X9-DG protein
MQLDKVTANASGQILESDRRRVTAGHARDGLAHTWMWLESAGKPLIFQQGYFIEDNPSKNSRFRWASPETWMAINDFCSDAQIVNCDNVSKPYSFHEGGTNIAYADASVRFHVETMDPQSFVSLLTLAGREVAMSE